MYLHFSSTARPGASCGVGKSRRSDQNSESGMSRRPGKFNKVGNLIVNSRGRARYDFALRETFFFFREPHVTSLRVSPTTNSVLPPPPANSTRVQLSRFPHRNFPSRPRAAFHLRPIPQSRLSCYFLECVWATEDFSPPTSSGAAPAVAFPKTMRILRYARLALQPLLVFPKRIE